VSVALVASLAYSGSAVALIVGYVCGVFAGGWLAPALGALLNELFPTSVRGIGGRVVAGRRGARGRSRLVVFGAVATVNNRFGIAAVITFLPISLAMGLFWLVPETRGREPEDFWVDERGRSNPVDPLPDGGHNLRLSIPTNFTS